MEKLVGPKIRARVDSAWPLWNGLNRRPLDRRVATPHFDKPPMASAAPPRWGRFYWYRERDRQQRRPCSGSPEASLVTIRDSCQTSITDFGRQPVRNTEALP
jgi:hypothetical protein